ncbi:MAG: apolipoprotein N-acyltransferase [Candidatus Omnitrophica bacterium]|nr:apolipoprotein N-acyltransferase [Candidatus Omnitrophota bacterium]
MFFSFSLCFISALLLILSFPSTDFYLFAWFGLVPLFFALKNKNKKQTFFLSYLWGLIFWAGILYWLVKVTFLGYLFLVLYLAIYLGLFGLITNYGLRVTDYGLLFLPSAWVFLEFLRSNLFTGFAWVLLGYSQYKNLPLIQIADITGGYGVSFLIVLVNVAIYLVFISKESVFRRMKRILAVFVLLSLCSIYGYFKIHTPLSAHHSLPLRISLIQANISPYEKWDVKFKNEIIERYVYLTQMAVRKNSSLIIWPETAFPGFWEVEEDLRTKVLDLTKEVKTGILLGAPVWEGELIYNAAIFISGEGEEIKRYRKIHLVPFGEYTPFPKILGFLQHKFDIGDFTRGKEYAVFLHRLPCTGYPFSVLICFEDIFPNLVRNFVKKGAEFLINLTEDGWYGKSSASFQHLQALVFRAVENRRYMVRAANTGYSCVVSSLGKIVSELKDDRGERLFIRGIHTSDILPNSEKTIYTRFGDWFVLLCVVFLIFLL